jgi:hypothetical protein
MAEPIVICPHCGEEIEYLLYSIEVANYTTISMEGLDENDLLSQSMAGAGRLEFASCPECEEIIEKPEDIDFGEFFKAWYESGMDYHTFFLSH